MANSGRYQRDRRQRLQNGENGVNFRASFGEEKEERSSDEEEEVAAQDVAAAAAPAAPAARNSQGRTPARRSVHLRGRKKKSKAQTYHRVLVYFMRYRDQVEYEFGHQFTTEQLAAVVPNDLIRYFKFRLYGNPDADTDIEKPKCRSNALKSWKKSISYFMPNSHMVWNEIANVGNPTKSKEINKLIGQVKRKEAARRGAPSKKRRALFRSEFEQAMEHFAAMDKKEAGLFVGAFFRFQLHMAARGDDTAKARLADMLPFYQYQDYGITIKLCWSKNVTEERDAPTQLLVGAMDYRFCVLTSLALWLEHHFHLYPEDNDYMFSIYGVDPNSFTIDMEGEDNPEKEQALKEEACADYIKEKAYEILAAFFGDSDFVPIDDGLKGIHSIRKLALDIIRGAGCTRDDGDHRARWKGGDRQQDDYTSTTIPYVDGKVAFALCVGGACAYITKEESGVTDGWILDHVVPNLKSHVPKQVAVVLGRALLWLICDEDQHGRDSYVPNYITERVLSAIHCLGERCTLHEGENLVDKQLLMCDGIDSNLIIEKFNPGVQGDGGGGDPRHRHAMHGQETRMLTAQVLHLRREMAANNKEAERRDMLMNAKLEKMHKHILRLMRQPVNRRAAADEELAIATDNRPSNNTVTNTAEVPLVARLSKCPRTLHALWNEWEVGSATQKPVRLWTAQERGAEKHTIYKRKFLWETVSELVRAGHNAQAACDMIYNVYGEGLSVTKILDRLRADAKTGGHPQLRPRHL